MIYIDDNIYNLDLQAALATISQHRREYALRYKREHDQRLCVAAYKLLQQALSVEYGIDDAPDLVCDDNGKPRLENHPDIHFSLSHCREAAACVVSNYPVGIDVESVSSYDEQIAATIMSNEEMREIKTSPHPDIIFAKLWTMKESLYKLTGDDRQGNIAAMLDDTTQYRFTTSVHPHYVVTTCEFKQP